MIDRGFWHPERGYWQTGNDVPADILNGYPAGTIEVPLRPGPDYVWLEEGWQPGVPDIDAIRGRGNAAIVSWIEGFLAQFTQNTPETEITAWPTKAVAAAAHLAGNRQDMIEAEALITGEDPDELATVIQAKATLFIAIIARMTGLRRMASKDIADANTAGQVQTAVDNALATAHDILAELGLSQEN